MSALYFFGWIGYFTVLLGGTFLIVWLYAKLTGRSFWDL